MLKISDYVAMVAGFAGIFLFYLIFSGNLVIDYGTEIELPEISLEVPSQREEPEAAEYVVLYGEEKDSAVSQQVMEMLDKLKKDYISREGFQELSELQKEKAAVFLITAENLKEIQGWQALLEMAKTEGKQIFFTVLPKEDPEYDKELGIQERYSEIEIDGVMIFEGILVQGMLYYEELPMTVQSITLDASCTRMVQERSKENKKQNLLTPLVWKRQYGAGKVYACNGSFLQEEAGIGIFTGILADMNEVFLYPVVNSSAVLLDYCPDFEHVDQEMIYELYSRDPVMFIRDVIWPSMDKISHSEELIFSGRTHMAETTDDFHDVQIQMQRSGSVILGEEEGTLLPLISEGHIPDDKKRYQMETRASGEGLATCYLDMRQVLGGGEQETYEWAEYLFDLSNNMYDIYRNNHFLEEVNWREAEERYKRYVKIRPEFILSDDSIEISAEDFADVWYCVVRTERNIVEGDGYEVQKIGEEAYLLEIRRQEVGILMD